jgi:hypothetical protein
LGLQGYQTGLAGYQAGLMGQNALAQAAQSQQSYQQQLADAQYQQWMQSMTLPVQMNMAAMQGLAMEPLPYTQQTQNTGTTTYAAPGPTFMNYLGAGLGMLGSAADIAFGGPTGGVFGKLFGGAQGGEFRESTGFGGPGRGLATAARKRPRLRRPRGLGELERAA